MRIGVDLGGTKIEAIALDPAGATLARRRIQAPRGDSWKRSAHAEAQGRRGGRD
jgi:predicted NBD/HSP70 family sugar kinase